MTLTFNADKYTELLQKYQPKIIRSEQENEQALTIIEKLIHKKNRTPEEDEIYRQMNWEFWSRLFEE